MLFYLYLDSPQLSDSSLNPTRDSKGVTKPSDIHKDVIEANNMIILYIKDQTNTAVQNYLMNFLGVEQVSSPRVTIFLLAGLGIVQSTLGFSGYFTWPAA